MIKYLDYKVRELGAIILGQFVPYDDNVVKALALNAIELEERTEGILNLIHGGKNG